MGPIRSALVWLAFAGWGAVLSGCDSPTLPLPPPANPVITSSPDGTSAEITAGVGSALSGALVMIFNQNTETGVIVLAGPRGDYHARVPVDFTVDGGNVVVIWQRNNLGDSPTT